LALSRGGEKGDDFEKPGGFEIGLQRTKEHSVSQIGKTRSRVVWGKGKRKTGNLGDEGGSGYLQ